MTGEVEVLVTSLLDELAYPAAKFRDLYSFRWGVETFYGILKERLCRENFTGKTAESVRQDFYSTILISNLESVLTEETNQELEQKGGQNKYPLFLSSFRPCGQTRPTLIRSWDQPLSASTGLSCKTLSG